MHVRLRGAMRDRRFPPEKCLPFRFTRDAASWVFGVLELGRPPLSDTHQLHDINTCTIQTFGLRGRGWLWLRVVAAIAWNPHGEDSRDSVHMSSVVICCLFVWCLV